MTLPASGKISLADMAAEFGMAASSALSAFYGKGGAPASGALGLSDFYGRSAALPISTTTSNIALFGYSQSGSATITATGGRTITSITLVGGSANARIVPGATGGASSTLSVTTPSTGTNAIAATYRFTCSTGEFVDVSASAEWGT